MILMILQLIELAIAKLAALVRSKVETALSQAIEDGTVRAFARAGLDIASKPPIDIPTTRVLANVDIEATDQAAPPERISPAKPADVPNNGAAPIKRPRGRPRKHIEYEKPH